MDRQQVSLPENAHRELKPGEEYQPILDPGKKYAEATPYSVALGILMVILFSAAAAYLGLKVGQVFEAAIPIAIIAVGLTGALGLKQGLSQNVIIQSIGGCSGAVVAGAIFTLPAIYILGVEVGFWQMVLSSLLGGVLGILFLIPFRKYFVKEMHGKYPFPEATATTQVLISGEGGGGTWAETISTTVMGWGATLADKAKLVLKMNTGAAVLGLGYIIGLKYSFIICCGSLLVWLVIIPLMNLIWGADVIRYHWHCEELWRHQECSRPGGDRVQAQAGDGRREDAAHGGRSPHEDHRLWGGHRPSVHLRVLCVWWRCE